MSPCFIATGQQPLLPMDLVLHNFKVPTAEDFPKDIKFLWSTIYQRERHQAIKDKSRADKARRQSTIQVGDLVMLSTRHLVLKAVIGKLKPRFVVLFQVDTHVGAKTLRFTQAATI